MKPDVEQNCNIHSARISGDDPKVSVIVPVYNVEPYLEQCLESLNAQTLPEIEFILIDDGSTDNSGKIADQFAETHPRFRVIHQENKGYAGARNAAIPLAKGNYLGFVDSDDYAEPEMFEKLYAAAEKENADISGCSFYYYYQNDDQIVPCENSMFCRLLKENHGKFFGGAESSIFDNAVTWNKIYSREMIEKYGIRFADDMKMAEDVPFFWCSYLAANKIVVSEECLYYYRNQRAGQQTSFHDERIFSFFTLFDHLSSFMKGQGITGFAPWLLHLKLSRYCYGYERICKDLRKEFFQRCRKDFQDSGVTLFSPVAKGPFSAKYCLLFLLHPLTKIAVLLNFEWLFSAIVGFRKTVEHISRIFLKKTS